MIGKERPVSHYYIGEEFVIPRDNEEIMLIPHQWASDSSSPWIEHRIRGEMVAVIPFNAVSGVWLKVSEPGDVHNGCDNLAVDRSPVSEQQTNCPTCGRYRGGP